MRKFWTIMTLVAALLLTLQSALAQEKSGPGGTDAPAFNLGGATTAKSDEIELKPDKVYEFKTDDDISTGLQVGDIYRDPASDKNLFRVKQVLPNGKSGGVVIFERVSGKAELPDGIARFQGVDAKTPGPESLKRRVTMIDYFFQGGFTMWGILALAVAMLVLAVNGIFLYVLPNRQIPGAFVTAARARLKDGDVKAFRELSLNTKGLLPTICRAMTESFKSSTIDDMKERTQIAASTRINALRMPIRALNLISVAAPLVGLFGTIVGMMVVFNAVAGATGAAKATQLAAGIKIKLMCTAAALSVAIPALLIFFIYNTILNGIIARCETICEQFMHRLALIKRAGGDVAEPVAAPAPAKIKAAPVAQEDDGEEEVVVVRKKKAQPASEEEEV